MTIEAPDIYRSSTVHGSVIRAVDNVLDQGEATNVNVDEIIVTGERGAVCIVIVPHHLLGGVSLVAWSDDRGVQLSWGLITTLRRHDDIDTTVRVSPFIAPGDTEATVNALAAEFERPIRVQMEARRLQKPVLTCSIDNDGEQVIVGRLPYESPPFAGDLVTSLARGPLPFASPVPSKEWRRST